MLTRILSSCVRCRTQTQATLESVFLAVVEATEKAQKAEAMAMPAGTATARPVSLVDSLRESFGGKEAPSSTEMDML